MASFGFSTRGIDFYYPKDERIAKCKILLNDSPDNNQNTSWRIVSKYPNSYDQTIFGYYQFSENEGNSNFQIDGNWHPFSSINNQLLLNFSLKSNIEDNNLYFEILHLNQTNRYKIQFHQYIPNFIALLGRLAMYFIVFIFFSLIISHLIVNIIDLQLLHYKTLSIFFYIEELALLALSFICLYYFIGPGYRSIEILGYLIIFFHLIFVLIPYLIQFKFLK